MGTYYDAAPKVLGHFNATEGWEDLFEQKRIDQGNFYASKDNLYPSRGGKASRRINWGWAQVSPGSTQTLPREITFNAPARTLQQYPIEELKELRGQPTVVVGKHKGQVELPLRAGSVNQAEIVATFDLPSTAETLSVHFGETVASR